MLFEGKSSLGSLLFCYPPCTLVAVPRSDSPSGAKQKKERKKEKGMYREDLKALQSIA